MWSRSLALAALVLCAGCIPIVVERTFAPRTAGVLTAGGAPVEGAVVYRTRAGRDAPHPCRAPADGAAVTSADGLFDLPRSSRRVAELYFLIITEAPPQQWTTCFVVDGDTLVTEAFVWPPRQEVRYACATDRMATTGSVCLVKQMCPSLWIPACSLGMPGEPPPGRREQVSWALPASRKPIPPSP